MRTRRVWFTSVLVASLLGLCGGLAALAPAVAATGKHPKVAFNPPVCVSALGVSFTDTVNWRTGPVGTESVDWGDGHAGPASIPESHVYADPGTYPITLTAINVHGTGTATSTVTVGPNSATCVYKISPQPMAEAGTMGPGQSAAVVVKITKPSGGVVSAEEPVWLSIDNSSGGGSATACCTADGATEPVALSSTPTFFMSGAGQPKGEVVVTYTTPTPVPDSGADVITAAGVPSTPADGSASTSYQFSTTPIPESPPPSIPDDCSVDVSKTLGPWFRNLPPNTTVEPPDGACYRVDEGLSLNFPAGLTVDGGTYENLSTSPGSSGGHGTLRGDPVWNVFGGTGLTIEDMTIEGADPGGYVAKMAFAAGIELQGTVGSTISNVTIAGVFGDGITLNPLRSGAAHNGGGIINPTESVTVSDVTINGAGRMGISFVSVNGAAVTNVDLSNVGLDTFDVEADQGNEGSVNVIVNGCTASTTGPGDFFANGGAGSGKSTGNITVSNCVMQAAQAGTALWVHRPGTGGAQRGPFVFDSDVFDCGASTTVSCVMVTGGNVTVQNSTLTFAEATPPENVYDAKVGSSLTFTDDTVTGYGNPGTSDDTSTVTITDGTWTPAPTGP